MKRMLLVCDHAIFTQAMRIVGGMGFPGLSARSRRAGSLGSVVVDLMLPDGDGAELVAEIKSRRPGLPVVVLSANDDLSGALEAGAGVAMRIRACLSPRSSSPSDGPPVDGKDRTPEARESV